METVRAQCCSTAVPAPRSFRGTIVASTVGLMTVSMIVVGLFIQLLLSRAADNDVDEVLHQRADAAVAVHPGGVGDQPRRAAGLPRARHRRLRRGR